MALKQKHMGTRNVKKSSGHNKKKPIDNPWSFLEMIDAPQWADLSLEASVMGAEVDDPWFHNCHKHHQVSLAGLNASMSWLRLDHTSQRKSNQVNGNKRTVAFKDLECSKSVFKSNGVKSTTDSKKPGPFCLIKQSPLQNAHKSHNNKNPSRFPDSQCTLSGVSSISEAQCSGSNNRNSSCSGMLSVTSRVGDGSMESRISSCSINCESSTPNETVTGSISELHAHSSEISSSNSEFAAVRNRNSSGASFCPPRPKLRFSFELGLPKSAEMGYSDHLSPAESVVTAVSGLSSVGPSASGSGEASKLNEEPERLCESDLSSSKESVQDGMSANMLFTKCNGVARRVINYGATSAPGQKSIASIPVKLRERDTNIRGSLAGSSFFISGKCHAQQSKQENLKQVQLSCGKENAVDFVLARSTLSKQISTKYSGLSSVMSCQFLAGERDSEQDAPESASQGSHSSISENLTGDLDLSGVSHKRRAGKNQRSGRTSVSKDCSKSESSEKDLAALVAQHNRKLRTLGVRECKKGWR